jgi:ubiquinone biosynthesis protein Coq4
MTEYDRLRKKAIEKGWKVPRSGSPLDAEKWDEAWIAYWRAMENYEANPERVRPAPPHRSGSG